MSGHEIIHDPKFWDHFADGHYETTAHRFTSLFAERALDAAALPEGAKVLDIATGTGAQAVAAALRGFDVLATDFSAGMIDRVLAFALPNLDARQMDGQALDLADGSFDAAFSMFGIMLFPDWRIGLAEMARVIRPGGLGVLGTWQHPAGAGTSLLFREVYAGVFPDRPVSEPPLGMAEWREPSRFEAALTAAGFIGVSIIEVTHDFLVDQPQLEDPDRWFGFNPLWQSLNADERRTVVATVRAMMPDDGAPLAVPSTALIATARRP